MWEARLFQDNLCRLDPHATLFLSTCCPPISFAVFFPSVRVAGREQEAQEYGRKVVYIREKVAEAGGTALRRPNVNRNTSVSQSQGYVRRNARRSCIHFS